MCFVVVECCEKLDALIVEQEYDLEQKIDVEIRIREGTTKLLAACQHPSQALEAAKTLQTSNERMNAYTTELQLRKHDPSPPSARYSVFFFLHRDVSLCFFFRAFLLQARCDAITGDRSEISSDDGVICFSFLKRREGCGPIGTERPALSAHVERHGPL